MTEALILAVKDYQPDRHGGLGAEVAACMRQIGAEFDGTELSGKRLTIYCYGPSAEAMYMAIESFVESWDLAAGSTATLRFGEPGEASAERVVSLGGANKGASRKRTRRVAPKKRYEVGDWFAVPIFGHGYIVGRVTCAHSLMMIGYYFGPLRESVPSLDEVRALRPKDAFTYYICGDNGLREDGNCVVLGGHEDFDPRKWPNPEFAFTDHRDRVWAIHHDENLQEVLPFRRVRRRARHRLPKNAYGLGGPEVHVLVVMIEQGTLPESARQWVP